MDYAKFTEAAKCMQVITETEEHLRSFCFHSPSDTTKTNLYFYIPHIDQYVHIFDGFGGEEFEELYKKLVRAKIDELKKKFDEV